MVLLYFLYIVMLSTKRNNTDKHYKPALLTPFEVFECKRYFFENIPVNSYQEVRYNLLKNSARAVFRILKKKKQVKLIFNELLSLKKRKKSFLRKRFELYLKQMFLGTMKKQKVTPEFVLIASLALHSSWVIYKLSLIRDQNGLKENYDTIETKLLNAIDLKMNEKCPWKIKKLFKDDEYKSFIEYLDTLKGLNVDNISSQQPKINSEKSKAEINNFIKSYEQMHDFNIDPTNFLRLN